MTIDNKNLFGKERLQELAEKALRVSDVDQTQVSIQVAKSSLTRFASSIIHQNVSETNGAIGVRAIIGKKIGYAESNSLEGEDIKNTVKKAVEFAQHQQDNPDFRSLPSPKPIPNSPQTYFESTAASTPEARAASVEDIVKTASKYRAEAAGSFSAAVYEQAIANSLGINAYNAKTSAELTMVMTADTGFGYSNRIAQDISEINAAEAAEEAAKIAADSRSPIAIEPGEYDVVLTHYCTEDMLRFLSWLGFSALALQEGRSFMTGKLGEKICGENITIWDDGLDPRGMVCPFDGEGVPKQKVDLIVNGVAKAVVYDSLTAGKEGKESTGHGTGGTGTHGPFAWNMFMKPGNTTLDDMIASTERGLLVTRFNYTNVVHPMLTIFTGMTRDGTFLIENGRVTKPVKNLRFTQSILEALSNVEMIGKDLIKQGMATVPAIKVKNFRFTGTTEF